MLEKRVIMQRASCRMLSYSSRNPGRRWATLPDSSTACSSSAALTTLPQDSPWYRAAFAALQCTNSQCYACRSHD